MTDKTTTPVTPWTQLDQAITDYCEAYEWLGGDIEDPRLVIEDAIQGLLANDELLDQIVEAREFTRASRRAEGVCEWCGARLPEHWGPRCRGRLQTSAKPPLSTTTDSGTAEKPGPQ